MCRMRRMRTTSRMSSFPYVRIEIGPLRSTATIVGSTKSPSRSSKLAALIATRNLSSGVTNGADSTNGSVGSRRYSSNEPSANRKSVT
ncbi:hypothetical protein NP493_23g01040 [Ridgeia piscesae]|uniref:Uncharacterized protein n=1 Tax=Ridgeia piscesae TaxID=27915 RepID=A0AAD9UKC9_RIDPI|nr:hypothetical protein NP493_23g01040 [Ridgeia piscesae]